VTATSDSDAVTVSISGTYTGTLTGETATGPDDIVSLANGSNISGATIGAGFVALTLATGGSYTMTAAQNQAFTGTKSAAGAETVTLTTAGTVTAHTVIETYNLANGTNTVTAAGTESVTINGGTGADTINISAQTTTKSYTINFGVDTATDRLVLTNAALDATHTNVATVSNFNVSHDALKTVLNATTVSGGAFLSVAAGGQTNIVLANTPTGSVIEITGTNLADLTDTADGGTVEQAIFNALGTLTGTPTYTVIIYGGGNAGIYIVTIANGGNDNDVTQASDMVVEHVATLTGVAVDSLGSANFFG
jgi:hypothetical protein